MPPPVIRRNQPYNTFPGINNRGIIRELKVQDELVAPSSFVDGVTITGDGSAGNPLTAAAASSVVTDATLTGDGSLATPLGVAVPLAGLVAVAVDGVTITGDGTAGSPLAAPDTKQVFEYTCTGAEGAVITIGAGQGFTARASLAYVVIPALRRGAANTLKVVTIQGVPTLVDFIVELSAAVQLGDVLSFVVMDVT